MIYTPFIRESKDSLKKLVSPPVIGYKSKYINPEPIEEVVDDVLSEEKDIINSSTDVENKNDLPNSDRRGLFRDYYTQSGVDESRYSFFEKLAYMESGFNPTIQNSAGYPAWGYFQFMDGSYTDKSGNTRKWDNIRNIANVDVTTFINNPILQIQSANKLANKFLSSFSKKDLAKARESGYSDSALVAGAWLAGAGGVKKFLHKGKNSSDVHGTNVKDRMDEFNNYFKYGGVIKFADGGKEDVLNHLDNTKDHIQSLYPLLGDLPYRLGKLRINRAREGFTDTIPAKGRYYPDANFVQISSNKNTPEEFELVKYHEYSHAIDSIYKKKLERSLSHSGGLTWDDGTKANLDLSELIAYLMTEVHDSGADIKNMTYKERMDFVNALKNKYTTEHHYTYKLGDGRFKHVIQHSDGKIENGLGVGDKVEDVTYYREYDKSVYPFAEVNLGDLLTALDVIYSPAKDIRKGQNGMKFGNDIHQQVHEWASNKNGELRYALKHDTPYPTFYKLLRDPNRPTLDLGDGTHKLSYAQDNNGYIIYPEIQWVQDSEGNWVGTDYSEYDDWTIGFNNAIKNGDYLRIPTEDMAEYFTKNYKTAFSPNWYPGFDKESSILETSPYKSWVNTSRDLVNPPYEYPDKISKLPSYIYNSNKSFDPNQRAGDGNKYRDIVKNRISMASSALRRAGFINQDDIDRLSYILAMQSIRETGWINQDSKNNYGGYKSGEAKRTYKDADTFWDAHIQNLDDRWSNWRNAKNIREYLHILNDPDWYMKSEAEVLAEQARRHKLGDTLYLYTPAYSNDGRDYYKEVMDMADRFTYYYLLE